MPRRAPRPTLFPYTTLFRSAAAPHRQAGQVDAIAIAAELAQRRLECRQRDARRGAGPAGVERRLREHGEDRKSTRLNSSHLGISYAVFCLKKKRIPEKNNST